jgi:hypothetical protein
MFANNLRYLLRYAVNQRISLQSDDAIGIFLVLFDVFR